MSGITVCQGGFAISEFCGPADAIGGDRAFVQITTPTNRYVQMPSAVLELLVERLIEYRRTVAGGAQHQQRESIVGADSKPDQS